MAYDNENIFAKILRGEIPSNYIYEDEYNVAFHDIAPQAKIHILVIPKNAYISVADFSAHASAEEQASIMQAIGNVARQIGIEQTGYRVISNHGIDSHQEIPHLHFHILGGEPLGKIIHI